MCQIKIKVNPPLNNTKKTKNVKIHLNFNLDLKIKICLKGPAPVFRPELGTARYRQPFPADHDY